MKHISMNFLRNDSFLKKLSFACNEKVITFFLLLLLCVPYCSAQNITIKGKVTDSSKEPVIGAAVQVSGTTNGTITDTDGNYTLSNVSSNGTLVFSYVGMVPQKISVAGKRVINVVMK